MQIEPPGRAEDCVLPLWLAGVDGEEALVSGIVMEETFPSVKMEETWEVRGESRIWK